LVGSTAHLHSCGIKDVAADGYIEVQNQQEEGKVVTLSPRHRGRFRYIAQVEEGEIGGERGKQEKIEMT
jgi:hypothetical protein